MEFVWPPGKTPSFPLQPAPGLCWWCGAPADSREHRIKRTDIVREFGAGTAKDTVFINRARIENDTRGPNASANKFAASLCANCNNARSQPFDYAEEAFAKYYQANEVEIVKSRRINMAAVFPQDLPSRAENLRRYFVKHIGSVVSGINPLT